MDAGGLRPPRPPPPKGYPGRAAPPDPRQRKLAAYLQHRLMLPLYQNLDHELLLISAQRHVHRVFGRRKHRIGDPRGECPWRGRWGWPPTARRVGDMLSNR
jgi:hypothetical protein